MTEPERLPTPLPPLLPEDADARCGWCGHLASEHTGPSPLTRLCRVDIVVGDGTRECRCTIYGDGT